MAGWGKPDRTAAQTAHVVQQHLLVLARSMSLSYSAGCNSLQCGFLCLLVAFFVSKDETSWAACFAGLGGVPTCN